MIGLYGGVRTVYNKLVRPLTPEKPIPVTNIDGDVHIPGRLFDRTAEIEFKPRGVEAIRQYVNDGDHVVEVGTGHGMFSLVCHRQVATVETFEGAADQVEAARRLLDRNAAAESVRVRHALVEAPRYLWGDSDDAARLEASDLPPGDLLLLDCEGAEADIIPVASPRFDRVIVETHPGFGAPASEVAALLRDRGFELVESNRMDGPEKRLIVASRGGSPVGGSVRPGEVGGDSHE